MPPPRRTTESTSTLSFPPHVLRDHALVADGERGALFEPRGDTSGLLGGPRTPVLLRRVEATDGDAAVVRLLERDGAAPGLFTEELDASRRRRRGDLPRAVVHAAMLETAVTLAR